MTRSGQAWMLVGCLVIAGCSTARTSVVRSISPASSSVEKSTVANHKISEETTTGKETSSRYTTSKTTLPPETPDDQVPADETSSTIQLANSEVQDAETSDAVTTAAEQTAALQEASSSSGQVSTPPAGGGDEFMEGSLLPGRIRQEIPPSPGNADEIPLAGDERVSPPLVLNSVIDSVYMSFPLLRNALYGRNIANGANLAAQGAFDLKLNADLNNQPLGYYQTYRNGFDIAQPVLQNGGEVIAGYRAGRGNFEPWYGNRQTNDGGEFMAGLAIPLLQNRAIDKRRAELWITQVGQSKVEPEIKTQLLQFIRDSTIAYWEWVAAGQGLRVARELQALALDRDQQIRATVQEGDRPESDIIDNQRLIVARQVKLIEAEQKLQSSAVKLSLYLRDAAGNPFIPPNSMLPARFPTPMLVTPEVLEADIAFATSRRPELLALDFDRQQLSIELLRAQNELLPTLGAHVLATKDVGGPTSSINDKGPFQGEAGLQFTVPLQRRNANGKIMMVEGKLAQNMAKRQFTADKISVEVRTAVIALENAYRAIGQASASVRLNEEMQRFETIRLNEGASDLLRLNLREQATFDARVQEVLALLGYFAAEADYKAATAAELPEEILAPAN